MVSLSTMGEFKQKLIFNCDDGSTKRSRSHKFGSEVVKGGGNFQELYGEQPVGTKKPLSGRELLESLGKNIFTGRWQIGGGGEKTRGFLRGTFIR